MVSMRVTGLVLTVWTHVWTCQYSLADKLCPEVDGNSESCVCKSPKGVIDLRALSNRDGTARFKGVKDNHYYYYDFNPCQAFHSYSACIYVHVCQGSNSDSSIHFDIADQGSEEIWIDSINGPYLYYTGPGSREVKVYLHCERSLDTGEEKLTTTGDSKKTLSYVFDLYSCHACPGGCYGNAQVAAGFIGWALILTAVLSFAVYLAVGAIILKVHFGKEGWNIVPNKDFWNDLPNLVHEGCLFSCRTVCPFLNKSKENDEHEKMAYETKL